MSSKVQGMASRAREEDELGYTVGERRKLAALRQRDQDVRMHEQQHMSAAGGLVRGTPKYTLVQGPDGSMYAIAGHVHLDTSPEPTPEQTIEKTKKIQAAATAPGDASPQDLAVAARASMMEMKARGELSLSESSTDEVGGDRKATASQKTYGESWESSSPELRTRREDSSSQAPGVLPNCPDCVQHAFIGRFKFEEHNLLGVA